MGHPYESPPVLEALLTRLDELAIIVGPAAAPRLGAVREALAQASGLRARGDMPGAARAIDRAMRELAGLTQHVDPAEGALMRAVVEMFGAALGRGELGELERTAQLMREKSGATEVERKK